MTGEPVIGPAGPPRVGEQLERWLRGDGDRSLGALVEVFGDKSFAALLVVLLGVPALPLPTGGVTHVLELIAGLIALELIAGRRVVWLPRRWRALQLTGPRQERFITALIGLIRRLERHSRPRMRSLLKRRSADVVFGLLVLIGTAASFLAPPFSGLDTLPALGVVGISLGVILEDILIVAAGAAVSGAGIALEVALGAAALTAVNAIL